MDMTPDTPDTDLDDTAAPKSDAKAAQKPARNAKAAGKGAGKAGGNAKAKPGAKAGGAGKGAGRAKPAQDAQDAGEGADAPVVERAPSANNVLRVKDLLDRVAERSSMKKKDLREVIEATLTELGLALAAGEALNLPPFGKVRIGRKGNAEGAPMTLKLRPGGGNKSGKGKAQDDKEPLAEANEAG